MGLALKWPKKRKVVLIYQQVSEALGAVSFADHRGKIGSLLERWIAGYKLSKVVVCGMIDRRVRLERELAWFRLQTAC